MPHDWGGGVGQTNVCEVEKVMEADIVDEQEGSLCWQPVPGLMG